MIRSNPARFFNNYLPNDYKKLKKCYFIVAYNINLWYYFYLQLDKFNGIKLLITTYFIIIYDNIIFIQRKFLNIDIISNQGEDNG